MGGWLLIRGGRGPSEIKSLQKEKRKKETKKVCKRGLREEETLGTEEV